MTSSMTAREPVTDTLLIRSGLSMHRLLEQVYHVVGYFLLVLARPRFEFLTLALAGSEEFFALGLDFLAGLGETFLVEFGRLIVGFAPNLFGLFASLGDALVALLLGLGDDIVGLLFGLLDSFENLWPRHTNHAEVAEARIYYLRTFPRSR